MLLIDGHNFIGRSPGLSLAREEEAREALLRRIAAAKGSGGDRVLVVFDGDRPGAAREERFGGLRVLYSGAGRSADEEILRRVAAGNARSATVVTDDGGLARRVLALGARVESCAHFRARLEKRREGPASEKPQPDPSEADYWLQAFASREPKRDPS
jgi:predicted RNA-binding protein with PIN domain